MRICHLRNKTGNARIKVTLICLRLTLLQCKSNKYCIFSVIEGKIKGEIEVRRRQGRRRKKLPDDLKDRRGYCHLKEEAVGRNMWRDRFGRGFEPVVRQTTG